MNQELDNLLIDFIGDNTDLFRFVWRRNDSPTDTELDEIASAWDDEYGDDPLWDDIVDRLLELAQDRDWSLQQDEYEDDLRYQEADYRFDSDREDRLLGR